jgi:hypothetical protein
MTTQEAVRRLVETTVQDLAACLGGIVRQAVIEAVEAEQRERNGTASALVKPLSAEFAAVIKNWEEGKARELLESAGLLLMEAAEKLTSIPVEAVLVPENPNHRTGAARRIQSVSRRASPSSLRGGLGEGPAQTRLICLKTSVATAQGSPADRERVGEQERDGGNDSENSEDSDRNNSAKQPSLNPLRKLPRPLKTACGVLTERSLVAFLHRHEFVEVHHRRGERTFLHTSDQRLSVPPRHGGDQDIARGTAQNIVRRLKEILNVPLKLVAGEITEVRELAAVQ